MSYIRVTSEDLLVQCSAAQRSAPPARSILTCTGRPRTAAAFVYLDWIGSRSPHSPVSTTTTVGAVFSALQWRQKRPPAGEQVVVVGCCCRDRSYEYGVRERRPRGLSGCHAFTSQGSRSTSLSRKSRTRRRTPAASAAH